MDSAIASVRREYDERLSRLEAVLNERQAIAVRADALLSKVIAELRADTGDEDDDISEDEESRLWGLVDFSIDDEDEE
ncbi:hypothetical protein [Longimicrobium sp.]|jgi:hypothetical protein|uniref:hypothetical protein n=1 Tax=Longimicrobium sp. TaxID=2029185 RepID=UPI002ED79B2B